VTVVRAMLDPEPRERPTAARVVRALMGIEIEMLRREAHPSRRVGLVRQ
jgi:hypothetical protein